MLLSDEEAKRLKVWVMKKLEDISEADSDVLADYVLALIRTDKPDEVLIPSTKADLDDFLGTSTSAFVDELFDVVNNKPQLFGHAQTTGQVLKAQSSPSLDALPPPARQGSINAAPRSTVNMNSSLNESRKRSFHDLQEESRSQDLHNGHERANKHVKRGGSRNLKSTNGTQAHQFPMPAIDPNNPFAAMLALQAMGMQIPGLNNTGSGPPFSNLAAGSNHQKAPCRDYNTKGICIRGALCPFDHGTNSIAMPSEEYDPNNPFGPVMPSINIAAMSQQPSRAVKASSRGSRSRNGRSDRAAFSMAGPNYDQDLTSIVVEQIPEENFEEGQVRDFFSEFGEIEDVDMQPYKRLAIVHFANYESAKEAYESPKVIFENRFVKVYWYNLNAATKLKPKHHAGMSAKPQEPEFDQEKFAEQVVEAQRKHEERARAREVLEIKLRDIQKQEAELEKAKRAEQRKLEERLRAKGIEPGSVLTLSDNGKKKHHNTEALKAQLAALEEEARSMGIDPDAAEPSEYGGYYAHRGRGRGGFHGRGGYMGWNYDPNYRGRGRGSFRGARSSAAPFRGAVHAGGRYNLDLRPRRIKITIDGNNDNATWSEQKNETLREHLFSIGQVESIGTAEDDHEDDAVLVVFKDRATAEQLYYGPRAIQGLGKVTMVWVANSPPQSTSQVLSGDDSLMGNAPADGTGGSAEDERIEYEMAEEDERWIVT